MLLLLRENSESTLARRALDSGHVGKTPWAITRPNLTSKTALPWVHCLPLRCRERLVSARRR